MGFNSGFKGLKARGDEWIGSGIIRTKRGKKDCGRSTNGTLRELKKERNQEWQKKSNYGYRNWIRFLRKPINSSHQPRITVNVCVWEWKTLKWRSVDSGAEAVVFSNLGREKFILRCPINFLVDYTWRLWEPHAFCFPIQPADTLYSVTVICVSHS